MFQDLREREKKREEYLHADDRIRTSLSPFGVDVSLGLFFLFFLLARLGPQPVLLFQPQMAEAAVVDVVAETLGVLLVFGHRPPVAEPAHLVAVHRGVVEVLPPRPFQRLDRRHGRAGPERRDATAPPFLRRRPRWRRLVPAPALGREDGAFEVRVAEVAEGLYAPRFRGDGLDVFQGQFAHHLPDVVLRHFDDDEQVAVPQGRVGPQRLEEIGKPVGAHGQICFGPHFVAFLQLEAAFAVDREPAAVRGVEARGADDGVNGSMLASFIYDPGGVDGSDGRVNYVDVVCCQGFEIAWTGGQSSTERREVRHDVLQNLGLLGQSVRHILLEGLSGAFVFRCATLRDSVGSLHTGLE